MTAERVMTVGMGGCLVALGVLCLVTAVVIVFGPAPLTVKIVGTPMMLGCAFTCSSLAWVLVSE